jgi:putative transferase (TIGR04331 family)
MKRFLITTALEETWRDDVPVVFLGEWCRRFNRKDKWSDMDAVVEPYHWNDRNKLYEDYLYLNDLHEKLLKELAAKLNAIHNVHYSDRYWRILVGPWLGFFTQALFDRWSMLRQVIDNHQILGVYVLSQPIQAPIDTRNFEDTYLHDEWNQGIYGELMALMGVKIDFVAMQNPQKTYKKIDITIVFKNLLLKLANSFFRLFSKRHKFFIINSYLPNKKELWLQILLGQIPLKWKSIKLSGLKQSNEGSKGVEPKINFSTFESVIGLMLWRHMPKIFLNGYDHLLKEVNALPWPENPKVIFTSNAYSTDDIFKAWAAQKIEGGSRLLIGQHGGNFCMGKWVFMEEHQLAISDKFFTWGSRFSNPNKTIAIGNLKTLGKSLKPLKDGLIVLIEVCNPQYSYQMYSMPVASQMLNYFEDQYKFVSALEQHIRTQLIVQIYPDDYGWSQRERWGEKFPNVSLSSPKDTLDSSTKKSRIAVSSYNGATYLETISLGFPTLIFWDKNYWELREDALPIFKVLSSVGIYHESPESAAAFLNDIWQDIEGWWNSEATINARNLFREAYAGSSNFSLDLLSEHLHNLGENET